MAWDERRYMWLLKAIDKILLDGEPITEEDKARALMAAFLIGAREGEDWNVGRTEMERIKTKGSNDR